MMRVRPSPRSRRRAPVAVWALSVVLVLTATSGTSAFSFSTIGSPVDAVKTDFGNAMASVSNKFVAPAPNGIEMRIASPSPPSSPAFGSDSASAATRPKTADEEVIEAEAELSRHPTTATPKPPTATPTMTPAPVPAPSSSVPPSTTAAPIVTTVKPSVTPEKTPASSAPPSPTTTKPPVSSSPAPDAKVKDLSNEQQASTSRGSSSDASLDKTVVIVIVGIVAAIGVLALVVSRQIKNSLGDGDYSDDEL